MPVFSDVLVKLGLSKEQADIYESLLTNGPQGAGQLAKTTKVKRTYIYAVVKELIKKGLVIEGNSTNKTTFRAQSPETLRSHAETQKTKADLALKELDISLPSLTSAFILAAETPVVRTYEGISGLKEIYLDTIHEAKPIKAVLQTHEVDPEMYTWLTTSYAKMRPEKGIHAHVIVSSGIWSDEYTKKDEKELRTTRIVPSATFPFKHEVDIYGDKVAFINYKKGEALIGVVINHPQIAETMRAWFDLAWVGTEHVHKETIPKTMV